MRGPAVEPIVIAAGGTGGHLFPAEALAAELLARGERIALMTDARSTAFDSPAFANAERFVLKGSGLSGRGAATKGGYNVQGGPQTFFRNRAVGGTAINPEGVVTQPHASVAGVARGGGQPQSLCGLGQKDVP